MCRNMGCPLPALTAGCFVVFCATIGWSHLERIVTDAHFSTFTLFICCVVVAAAAIVKLRVLPNGEGAVVKDTAGAPSGHDLLDAGVFRMVPTGHPTPKLSADEERLQWFEDIAARIYEVNHGIFCGQVGGESLPSWPPHAFREALMNFRSLCPDPDSTWPHGGKIHEPLDDVALAQRLIASGLDVVGALELVQDYASYRRSVGGGGVCPTQNWLEAGIAIVPCEDRLGRPVISIRPRYHRPGNLELFKLGLRSALDVVKAHLLHRRGPTFSETNPLEQYVMVWDFEGASLKNLDWDAFHCTIKEGQKHYPNMGSQIYVLNVNAPMRWIWSAASKLMHPRIRRKCFLVAPKDVHACMRCVVAPELLPPQYGGTGAPWPGPQDCETLEDQVGELAAAVYRRADAVPAGAKPSRHTSSCQNGTAMGPVCVAKNARPRFGQRGDWCTGAFDCWSWSRKGGKAAQKGE